MNTQVSNILSVMLAVFDSDLDEKRLVDLHVKTAVLYSFHV